MACVKCRAVLKCALLCADSPDSVAKPANGAYWVLGNSGADCSTTCSLYGGCNQSAFSNFPLSNTSMKAILESAGLPSSSCTAIEQVPSKHAHSLCLQKRSLPMQGSRTLPTNPVLDPDGKCYYGGQSETCLEVWVYPQMA